MDLEHAKQTFIEESRQSVRAMEGALLRLETAPDDKEALDAAFRAAHTVKGSSGMFGFDAIVAFTHVMESVLHRVRDGGVAINKDLIALLLSCGDHIVSMVDRIAVHGETLDGEMQAAGVALGERLGIYLGPEERVAAPATPVIAAPVAVGSVASDTWHISLRFGRDVLRDGMDPLSFIRYLGTLGEIVHLTAVPDALPGAAEMDPESCYLGFEIDFRGTADAETIAGVFEFVREGSVIHILPPHSAISAYIQLIEKLPEDKTRLAEIFVAGASVTRRELEQGRTRENSRAASGAQTPAPPANSEAAEERRTGERRASEHKSSFIHVPADKLDQLINLVGELVIAGASASLLARQSRNAALQEATSAVSQLVEEVRDGALQLRMVQIGDTFSRFNRIVHDMSHELGKDIQLVISGAETELDKTVIEKISDPLTHLVRNAIDHGIEAADARAARGKPAAGTVRLNAYHESGSIVIEVDDDGGGLPRDKILQKALERGMVSAGQSLSDQEIYNLIFEAGFSTSHQVTALSGRGVGMDVVRRNVQELRGTVEIENHEAQGATIRIRLPLTLAIIDGFLLGVGDASYVVPLDMMLECVELSAEERSAARVHNYINLRGAVLPLLHLREVFEVAGDAGRRENIVVVQSAGARAGLVVDALLGEFQTVIKPLGKVFERLSGISGSTILGTGEVALILDVPSLVQQAIARETQQLSGQQTNQSARVR